MIKAIIFDCFGVLTVDSWKEFVATLPDDKKQQARDINQMYDAGFITNQQFMSRVEEITGKIPSEINAVRVTDGSKNVDLLGYIATQLKPNYKIGLLSNVASNYIRDSVLDIKEQALFDDMVFSYLVGTTKPDPAIFELSCERLGVEPSEAIMIDDVETYCLAAERIGMKGIVYSNFQQLKAELGQVLDHS